MMFSAMRRRMHLSPATAIAGLALVFAMSGGAYAAKKYLITSTKQISPSVLKQLQGKAGAPGAAGASGTQGAQGPAGPAGAKGDTGSAGEKGVQGEKGLQGEKGVEGKKGATGATGATGPTGVSGFTTTLPSGKTETGNWDASTTTPADKRLQVAISFPIPLETSLPESKVHYLNFEETELSPGHPGKCEFEQFNIEAKPVAPKGELCVFTTVEEGSGEFLFIGNGNTEKGAFSTGTFVGFKTPGENEYVGTAGVWAVTAP